MNNTIEIIENPLVSIVKKLEIQKNLKQDIIVPSNHIRYTESGILQAMTSDLFYDFNMTDHAHDQMALKLGIPGGYYQKLKSEFPSLLSQNINGWLSRSEKTKYLLRTFNYKDEKIPNICRAMLSNKYNCIDNYDVLIAALEAIKSTGIHIEIVKAEITDKRMYLHVVAPEIHVEATKLLDGYLENRSSAVVGRGIISGLVITNSEVGMGTFEVSARAQILQCTNGMHDRSAKFRKVHLGARLDDGIINWSQEVKNKNYELIMAQTKDAVNTFLSKEYLGQLTDKLAASKGIMIENPSSVIDKVSAELEIPEEHKMNVLRYFLQDGDESAFGMMNAFTRQSQKMSADLQYNVESGIFEMLPNLGKFDKPLSKN